MMITPHGEAAFDITAIKPLCSFALCEVLSHVILLCLCSRS